MKRIESIGMTSGKVTLKIVSNIYGTFRGPSEIETAVRGLLTIRDPDARFTKAFKFHGWDGMVRFMSDRNVFKLGLLPMIYNYCIDKFEVTPKIISEVYDIGRPGPISKKLADIVLRDYQLEILHRSLFNDVGGYRFPRGIIYTATNSGKSLIIVGICKSLLKRVPVLILTHRHEILIQIKEWISEQLGIPVGVYDAKHEDLEDVTVSMITTLYSRIKSDDVRAILNHYGCLIVDEVHHAQAKSWLKVIEASRAFYRYGLSGTALEMGEHKRLKIIGAFGEVLGRISNKELVEWGYSARPEIELLQVKDMGISDHGDIVEYDEAIDGLLAMSKPRPLEIEDKLRDLRRKRYALVYELGISNNQIRADILAKSILEYYKSGKSVLIVVERKGHGRFLRNILKGWGIKSMFVHGGRSESYRDIIKNKLVTGKVKVVIATMIYKEGIDIPCIDVLVLACGGKAPITVLQVFGRGLRKSPNKDVVKVIDFYDGSHKMLSEHSDIRLAIYKKEGFNPKIVGR